MFGTLNIMVFSVVDLHRRLFVFYIFSFFWTFIKLSRPTLRRPSTCDAFNHLYNRTESGNSQLSHIFWTFIVSVVTFIIVLLNVLFPLSIPEPKPVQKRFKMHLHCGRWWNVLWFGRTFACKILRFNRSPELRPFAYVGRISRPISSMTANNCAYLLRPLPDCCCCWLRLLTVSDVESASNRFNCCCCNCCCCCCWSKWDCH